MEKAEATAQLVKEEINSSIYLKEILKKGLINYSALAREILPKIKSKNSKANFASILIALQRYYEEVGKENTEFEKFVRQSLPNCELIIKNKIMTLSFHRTKRAMTLINEISKDIRWDMGDIMFFIQGSGEITVITDKKHEAKFDKLKSELVEKKDSLALLSIREPDALTYSKEVPGFLALLTQTLSDNGINIYESATTFKQTMFIVHEKDITKAYEAFNKLIEHYKK